MEKGTLTQTPFNIITNSDILTKEDIDSLTPLTEELQENFIKAQMFRTRTEMEVSVLNDIKFPTPAAKYWQSVREQNVMFNELVMLSYEYRKNIIKIKKIQRKIKEEKDELDKELLQIELERKMFISKSQERTAKDRIRELKAWSEIKDREAAKMTEEELADVDNHQLVSYTKRWINQALIAGNSGSPAEKNNLQGQLIAGVKACREKGLIDNVLKYFSEEVKKDIKQIK